MIKENGEAKTELIISGDKYMYFFFLRKQQQLFFEKH